MGSGIADRAGCIGTIERRPVSYYVMIVLHKLKNFLIADPLRIGVNILFG